MRRLRSFRMALPLLVATSLTACGSTPPSPTQAVPQQGASQAQAGTAQGPSTDGMGRLWGDPMADQTPVTPGDGGPGGQAPAAPSPQPSTFVPPAPAAPPPGAVPLVGTSATLIPFASNRPDGGNWAFGFDIFIYDRASGTVVAPAGVNTPADEVNPRLTADGTRLIFATNITGDFDIQLFDVPSQIINTLPTLNSPLRDDREPSITLDGRLIAYSSLDVGYGFRQLRIHDVPTGQTFVPAPVQQYQADVFDPCISADGSVVAYASFADLGQLNVFLYNIGTGALLNPPFVNTEFAEFDPSLSDNGQFLLFTSDRTGTYDIFMTDLTTGFTDRLPLANSPFGDRNARFIGPGSGEVLFQTDRTGFNRLMIFQLAGSLLDTLPISHEIGADDLIDDQFASGGAVDGYGFGFGLGGGYGFGGFGRRGLF